MTMAEALPRHRAPFFERPRSMSRIRCLLQEHRLVTLTGVGGSGKTRLALRLAEEKADGSDEVGWAEFAPLEDPRLVAATICSSLRLRLGAEASPREVLVRRLESRKGLLVLDNCEHVREACVDLATELLDRCPELRILATSREPLGAAEEVVWPVPTLSVPDLDGPAEVVARRVSEAESAQFFVQRLRASRPNFELTPANAGAVGRLCSQLDGIPLALELAAARTRVLTPEQIAEHLERGLGLLSRAGGRGPERHRTMTAALDWSYRLLEEPEQTLFRRLAVFGGRASLEACETVCRGGEVRAAADVVDLLGRLIDKSLVVVDEGEGPARYRLLEPVRRFALERLEESGERLRVERRHAAYFVTLAERWAPDLRGPGRGSALSRLESAHDDLRRAWDRCVVAEDWEGVARLAGALFWFWNFGGHFVEARRRSGEVVERMPSGGRGRADLLWASGALAWMQGDYGGARDRLEACVADCRAGDREDVLPLALRELAGVRLILGDLEAARDLYEESSALLHASGRDWDRALSLIMLADTRYALDDPEAAARIREEARAIFARVGDPWGLALAHFGLAMGAAREGDLDTARGHAHEALALQRTEGDDWNSGQVLALLGEIEGWAGNAERATEFLLESLEAFRVVGDRTSLAHTLRVLAALEAMRGRTLRSVRLAGAGSALAETVEAPYPYALATEDDHQEMLRELRRYAGEEAFVVEWAAGRSMSMDEAVAFALQGTRGAGGLVPEPPQGVSARLRIFGLGLPQLFRGRRRMRAADWTYALPREMLFYFLLHGPRTKEQIGLDFWPEASRDQLRGRFRTALYHLRRALGGTEWVRYEGGRYAFNRDLSYWFDVEAFESGLDKAGRRMHADPRQAAADLQKALELYQGDFLEGERPGRWAAAHRDRLRRRHRDALLQLSGLRAAQGAHELAVALYRRAIACDEMSEEAHRGLARSLAALGNRAGALRQLAHLEELLRSELGVDPSSETLELRSELEGRRKV